MGDGMRESGLAVLELARLITSLCIQLYTM